MTAAAYAIPVLALAGCAWAFHRQLGAAIVHARWAWRCRGHPVPADGDKPTYEEARALSAIGRGLRHGARAERTRT